MALFSSNTFNSLALVLSLSIILNLLPSSFASNKRGIPQSDVDLLEFPLNLEYLEAEFFLWGSLGYGLDKIAPELTGNGPEPIGAKIAKLGPFVKDVVEQFAFQEVGHRR